MSYARFAIYYLPPEGALADFGAGWLGWDCVAGRDSIPPHVPGLDDVTMTPRKYGFHGTLKPPFRLAEGTDAGGLRQAVAQMAQVCPAAQSDALTLTALGRFLALTPVGDTSGIARVAATCVEALDAFRAPPGEAELERRRKARLSDRQEALLQRWGYPYVMEEFRFHMTLTGRLSVEEIDHWSDIARAHLPPLPSPFVMDEVALVGERQDGRFELIQRYALAG
jgi:putative phosphonate metabolism protein